jgi:ribosome-binding protein aMBF1 (putative translation factor)
MNDINSFWDGIGANWLLHKKISNPTLRPQIRHNRDIPYLKALRKNLRRLRLKRKLSQEGLSFQYRIPPSQIGRIERGERDPSASTMRVLAEGLGENQNSFGFQVQEWAEK